MTPPSFQTRHLLFVDDETHVLDAINRSLRGADLSWSFEFTNSVDAALKHLAQAPVDVIVTDITMPGRDGFDLLSTVTADPNLSAIPVIVLTGLADTALKRKALNLGAFDLIGKPVQREDLLARLRSVLRTKGYQDSLARMNATLEAKVAERTREVEASRTDILICLAMAGECRDTDTGHHLIRVARYAKSIAEAAGLSRAEVDTIFKVSPLHDIGKLGVPDHVLLKPGPLDEAERTLMQAHCEIGHRILTTPAALAAAFKPLEMHALTNPLLNNAAEIALHHHERWDGTGYPFGKSGDEIPLAARIVAIADVYDALTSVRPYKKAISHTEAIALQVNEAGQHFDPALVHCLQTKAAEEFADIRGRWSDSCDNLAVSLKDVFAIDGTAAVGTPLGATAPRSG